MADAFILLTPVQSFSVETSPFRTHAISAAAPSERGQESALGPCPAGAASGERGERAPNGTGTEGRGRLGCALRAAGFRQQSRLSVSRCSRTGTRGPAAETRHWALQTRSPRALARLRAGPASLRGTTLPAGCSTLLVAVPPRF